MSFWCRSFAMPMCLWQENQNLGLNIIEKTPPPTMMRRVHKVLLGSNPAPFDFHESVSTTPSHKRTQNLVLLHYFKRHFFFLTILYRRIPAQRDVRHFRCRQFPRAGSRVIIALHVSLSFLIFVFVFLPPTHECPSEMRESLRTQTEQSSKAFFEPVEGFS